MTPDRIRTFGILLFMEKDNRELFKGVAWHYARYRVEYTNELFEELVQVFQLDKTNRILDIGCGTGQLTIPLASYVKEAVGLDIETDMLDEARRRASEKKVENVRWVNEQAENISNKLGLFRLSTFGASFHWMQQESVLNNIYDITEKGGGIAIISNQGASVWYDTQEEPWKEKRKEVIQKFLGEKRRAGVGLYKEPEKRFEELLEDSPFEQNTRWTHDWSYKWDIHSIIGNLFSTSFASKKLFGDKVEEFEQELTEELLKINPEGKFTDSICTEALLAWKK